LVILAAGMGSRFGGLKQVQPVGPAGELIIEYSAYDALRAGFGRLVLVIRKDIEADFRATKPWGTGHAVLAAQKEVSRPFAVINADDFYGAAGYQTLAAHFATSADYAMVGYPLKQTLSEFGTVSRGLCATDAAGRLKSITEITKIEKTAGGARYTDVAGALKNLSGDEIVSMNFWGFTPAVFSQLEKMFADFQARHAGEPKAEFYLPTALSTLNERGEARVALLRCSDAWFGITYREDLVASQAAIGALIQAGQYSAPLWG
jgi:UTP-glucose-1-phosphate uridylyltransferase